MKNLEITSDRKVKCISSGLLYGTVVQYQNGWKFIPCIAGRHSSRKMHRTAEAAIPVYAKRHAAHVASLVDEAMKTNCTPGPWRKNGTQLSGNKHCVFIVGGDDGQYPTIFIESVCESEKEVKQFEANVDLILAAVNKEIAK